MASLLPYGRSCQNGSSDQTTAGEEHIDPFVDGVQEISARNSLSQQRMPHYNVKTHPAKDSMYGWVVVASTFCINVFVDGYIKSFGLLSQPIMEEFPQSSTASASWMMGLLGACTGILAPLMGALTVLLGARWCCIYGALLSSAGLLLALLATSIHHLALTLGGLVGIGLCMSETPGFIIVSEYFLHCRATANGFRAAGYPFGGIIFPFVLLYLNQEFLLKGSFLILSGLMLQMCVLGMLLRSFETHRIITERKLTMLKSETTTDNDLGDQRSQCMAPARASPKKKPLDFALLKNYGYIVYILMILFTSMGLTNVLYYLPIYGAYTGLSKLENSVIIAYYSILDFASRIFVGWLSDRNIYEKRHAFIVGQIVSGVGCLLVPLTSDIWTMLAVVCLPAIGDGCFWALLNTLLADQFGEEAMATSWGFFRMTQGITSFAYPSLLGMLADISGGMGAPFFMMGVMYILGALVFALQPLIIRRSGLQINLT